MSEKLEEFLIEYLEDELPELTARGVREEISGSPELRQMAYDLLSVRSEIKNTMEDFKGTFEDSKLMNLHDSIMLEVKTFEAMEEIQKKNPNLLNLEDVKRDVKKKPKV